MKSKNQLIIVSQSILIIILVTFLFKINRDNNLRKDYLEFSTKNFDKLSKKEYKRINDYLVFIAKKENIKPDTISYEKAKQNEEDLKALENEIKRQNNLKQYNCDEYSLTNSFHEIMAFNYPYETYDKNSINISRIGDCNIRVNVTTQEPKYGWKTFWIFEVFFDSAEGKFKMNSIKKKFLG